MAINFIKNGEKIKGQEKTITPSASQQTITPDEGYNALTSVTVNAVDNTIDSNIQASNIKKDVSILGVTGTLEPALEINPTNTFTDDTAKQFYDIQTAYDNMQPRVLTDTDKTLDKNIYCIPTKSDGTPLLDTSNVTNITGIFRHFQNLKTIPKLNTSNVTRMTGMFEDCPNLISIPQLDTSKVTDMFYMFWGCSNLINIPQLDTSKVTDMSSMFYNCISLSKDSLNNILAMLANATTFSGTKTLQYLQLTKEQATTCTTLSNWAACEAAGWTTGY